MAQVKSVVVTGATSLLGHFLLPRLAAAGYSVNAISRQSESDLHASAYHWYQANISQDRLPDLDSPEFTLIHLAPIWLLPGLLERSSGNLPTRIIAFSSTSRITKTQSDNADERNVAKKLAEGEERLTAFAANHAIPWTLFRPTLIYGAGIDKNISVIASFIQHFGFFPLIGECTGKRIPVHADDLSQACLQCLATERSQNRAYNLTGGEILSYREMVERIFAALGKKPRFVRIPLWSFQSLLAMASLLPRYAHLTPEMARRTGKDLVFDSSNAAADFGYNPRRFNPERCDIVRDC